MQASRSVRCRGRQTYPDPADLVSVEEMGTLGVQQDPALAVVKPARDRKRDACLMTLVNSKSVRNDGCSPVLRCANGMQICAGT